MAFSLRSSFKLNFAPLRFISTTNLKQINKSLILKATATASNRIPPPQFEGQPREYSPKIQQLVDQISQLNLLEVSDLNELLRKKLNIKDVAMTSFAASPATQVTQAQKAPEPEQEEEAPKSTKSSFRLKLIKYDESKKVALIKEIKALGENMNLVQAKKFIESMPQVFRDNIGKEEAEKLKEQLEKVGATCVLE
jgi:large subunit ribosomal protein L7/L12